MAVHEPSGGPVDLDAAMHPYRGEMPAYHTLPRHGRDREDVLRDLRALAAREDARWRGGYASGAVYNGDEEHIGFLNEAYAIHSQANPLHPDLWPSAAKYESEIISMTAHMLGAGALAAPVGAPDGICGSVTSGGSESILLAMKTYRDWARAEKGITEPEMVVPASAHAAFDKASQYFGIKMVHVPLDGGFRADVAAAEAAMTDNTVVLVGSATNFPYGTVDPIARLSELARGRGIGFHTDACLGGYFLPWVEKLGHAVPPFDFRVPGVTSMSCDTHKYGYAAKGTSVVLYRGQALRHHQYFTTSDWPGGLYSSPTLAGSRPGGLSAACWAALVAIGEDGYMRATETILRAVETMKTGVRSMPELHLLGDSIGVFAFASDHVNAYEVLDAMSARGWSLTGLQHPPAIHLSPTLRHAQPGVAERFVEDLHAAVAHVKANPGAANGMAPIYGMAATVPDRGVVHDMLKAYMDLYYQP
jgi:sphinganine-1-phosphate aldolase